MNDFPFFHNTKQNSLIQMEEHLKRLQNWAMDFASWLAIGFFALADLNAFTAMEVHNTCRLERFHSNGGSQHLQT